MVLVCCWMIVGARSVRALDVFTLWRQPEVPLQIVAGDWAEYRTQSLAGGRREEGLTRIVCLGREQDGAEGSWLFELLPLVETDGARQPVDGEGVQLRLSPDLLQREGAFLDLIQAATRWQAGKSQSISQEELRNDPLVATSLASDFAPDKVELKDPTTRIVGGVQFVCEQFLMAAADTQVAVLPAGRMVQVTTREIVAAVHPDIPFLGLAYVSERVRAESRLDPPSRRFKAPAPRVQVEVMELVAYGHGAKPWLEAVD